MRKHATHFDDCGCLSARKDAEIARLTSALANSQNVAQLTWDLLAERDAELAMLKDVAGDWVKENCRAERLAGLLRWLASHPSCRCGDDIPGVTGDCSCGWAARWREIRKEIGQ